MAKKLANLGAVVRKGAGSCVSRALRAKGKLPAVIYGAGRPTASLELDRAAAERVVARGERLIALTIDGAEPRERQAMIKDVQYEPVSHRPIHMDFQEIRADEKITVKVSLLARGTPVGALSGGVLNAVLREIEVQCLPVDVPEEIRVDISALNIGDIIRANALKLPEGVEMVTAPEAVVIALEAPRTEKDLEAATAAVGAIEPEVLTAKKEEAAVEGAAEGAEAAAAEKPEAKKPEAKEEKKKE